MQELFVEKDLLEPLLLYMDITIVNSLPAEVIQIDLDDWVRPSFVSLIFFIVLLVNS